MKFNKLISMLVLSGAIGIAAAQDIQALNSIAIEVNSSIITYSDITREVRSLRANPANQGIPENQLIQAARQQLLERALLADAARQQNLKASAIEVDSEIRRRAAAEHLSVEAFYQKMENLGWAKTQYRLDVAKDLVLGRLVEQIDDNVKISNSDVENFITQAQKAGETLPAAEPYTVYNIRRIVLNMDENNSVELVGNRMKLIAQTIQQGNDFAEMARRYSQEAAAAQGGVLEVSDYSEPVKVEQLLHTLKPGEMSEPIQTINNWQIVQVLNSYTETNPKKMQREAVRRMLVQQARQQAHAQFIGGLQQNAVVREY